MMKYAAAAAGLRNIEWDHIWYFITKARPNICSLFTFIQPNIWNFITSSVTRFGEILPFFDPIFGMRCTKAICTNKSFDDGLANKKMLISQIGPSSRYDGPIFYPIFLLTITI